MACTKRKVYKNLVVGFAVFYALSGIATLLIGTLADDNTLQYGGLDAYSMRVILITASVLALILAAIGGIGAMKENHCMLKSFAGILIVLVCVQIFHGIKTMFHTNDATQNLESSMNEVFRNYNNMEEAKTAFDTVQQTFHCCGMYSPEDWKSQKEDGSLPLSCCSNDDLNPSMNLFESEAPSCTLSIGSKSRAYDIGCLPAITDKQKKMSIVVGVMGFIFVVLKIFVIYCAFYLIRNKEKMDIIVVPLIVGEHRNEESPPPYKV